ncbi:N-alpha-acetyltransferase 20 isoform X1 [Monodon monoceros]|uniref:N-alpha-acetyltransferase 20 n=2 Tax=Monodontidae TaxID=9747 RepID=A0A8C6BRE6_MONMO|nr:N-alpha-acetyltransferase 20 isoform X1 [Delphinapterus leucas]XP_029076146.1 N-alpha-acetyltransferase 20 isoform X1 [Monodon monoceros]
MSLEWTSSPGGSVTSPATGLCSGTTLLFPGVPGFLSRWLPEHTASQPYSWQEDRSTGEVMGKAEGSVAREEWHGHVTALSVAPEFRRLGLAAKLMELLEEISERKGGFFVDLFVRVSNQVAVNMYKQLGYSVYRTVIEYYSASNGEPDEDAYDMRKALSRDTEKKSIIPLPHPVRPEDIE